MKIIGYGEDFLTLWALISGKKMFNKLKAGNDRVKIVFFRPSFGRGTGSFGEFDCIVSTKSRIILIECKWDGTPIKSDDKKLILTDKQVIRHLMFAWYRRYFDNLSAYKEKKPFGKKIVKEGTELYNNLKYILNEIDNNKKSKKIVNRVIYFYDKNKEKPKFNGVVSKYKQEEYFNMLKSNDWEDFKIIYVPYSKFTPETRFVKIDI